MIFVLMVIFIVVMLLWGLAKTGSVTANTDWLAFIAVLILGICIFLVGTGVIVIEHPMAR